MNEHNIDDIDNLIILPTLDNVACGPTNFVCERQKE